ncbi:unnamed protein product [Spodoptera littoralis]|uniref:Enoyl reductase (ER) domain-containing protein n=1 Tax=Spodoptera littoralis TaxID=7109 RepID=A0A9P0IF38_SPOLI|nr:unnamed protein product [Spodoptera littoralis]CAH1645656.1 unnamed protein product [Spodoptera littoralis]
MLKIPKTMRAVGLYKYLPIIDVNSLVDVEVNVPSVTPSDVLVEVKATAVNPIDAKQRAPKPDIEATPRILGWDGAGVVVSRGEKLIYSMLATRKKPKNWTFEQAAAIPLVTLTACESIFDRLLISEKDKGKSILIINSAGGVGSVATQIVKNLGLKVIGTASRPETQAFTRQFGADIVLNHTQDLIPQLEANGFGAGVDYILVNFDPAPYWDTMMKAIKPQGKICMLVDSSAPVNIATLKDKSITLVGEMMFTRVKYDTEDRIRHYEIFKEVSKWMEEGKLRSPLMKTLSPINAANLREAHKIMEEKKMIGKLVLTGF